MANIWPGCRHLIGLIGLIAMLWPSLPAWSQSGSPGRTLEDVQLATLPGGRLRISFVLDGPAPQPDTFSIDTPARLVIDFPRVVNGVSERHKPIGTGVFESLTVLEGGDRTRATLNLSRSVPYSIRHQGNRVDVLLEAAGGLSATPSLQAMTEPAPAPSTPARATPPARPTPPAAGTTEPVSPYSAMPERPLIDFRLGDAGQALISVGLPGTEVNVNLRQDGNRLVADIGGLTLSRDQERTLDVTDFATPVKTVDSFNYRGRTRIVVVTSGEMEYLAYQADDHYTLEVARRQPGPPPEEGPPKRQFSGESLSLNFQDIDVRAVLQILADFTGLNIVVSDSVQGSLTLRLKNVPWDQALDIILKTRGLSIRENGNVMLIAPTEEIAARERLEMEAERQTLELAPLRTDLIQINYAKASDIATLLEAEGASLLSDRGSVTVDERTNTILMQDTARRLSEVRRLISDLDRPVQQVLIDSRIVIANDDFSKELGIRWGGYIANSDGDNRRANSGSLAGTESLVQGNRVDSTGLPTVGERSLTNLGISDPFGQLAVALLGDDYLLELELSALQAEGRGEVLSNPRVITTNRNEAIIESGTEVPYEESTSSGATSVTFRDAKLRLVVTPQITPDQRILMDLQVEKANVGENVSTAEGGEVPTIDTRNVTTQVLVDNGETVVLGGIFERTRGNEVDKVPLLGDLPAIGRLFRRTREQNDKDELLIFVTPKILYEGGGIN